MIYNNVNKNNAYIELSNGENKLIMPASSAIIVDDESGTHSIKTTGSRKTIALVKDNAQNA